MLNIKSSLAKDRESEQIYVHVENFDNYPAQIIDLEGLPSTAS